MLKLPTDVSSLASLHDQSAELILHARRLQAEFKDLREASKLLRLESMRLRDDVRVIRKSSFVEFANAD